MTWRIILLISMITILKTWYFIKTLVKPAQLIGFIVINCQIITQSLNHLSRIVLKKAVDLRMSVYIEQIILVHT